MFGVFFILNGEILPIKKMIAQILGGEVIVFLCFEKELHGADFPFNTLKEKNVQTILKLSIH